MKNLRVGVKLDKSGFQKELNQLLKGNYNIKLDSSNFKTTIDGINKIKDSIKDLNTELTKMSNKNLASTSITADKNGITEVNKYRDSITQTTTEIIKNGKVTKQTITENIAQFEKLRNQMQSKLSSVVGSKFIDESVISKLQSQLSSLNTNSSVQEFNELKVAIDNVVASNKELQKQAEQALKEQQKQAQQAIKDEEKLIQQMARLREQSQARVDKDNSKWQLNQAQAINKALDEQYNLQQKQIASLDKLKSQMQQKLTVSASNNLVDTSTIDKLQQKLNSLNTNSSEKEIKELQNAINNLSSADGSIVRVQQQIIRLEERINKIKNNKIDLMTTSELSELRQAESELEKLRNTLSALKSGEIINGKAISNQINQANNSMRTLETSMRELNTAGSGLPKTFKEIFTYTLGGSGIYLMMNSFRNGVNSIIELQDSLRDLMRVTDQTSATYENFVRQANKTAIALGTSTKGAIDSATTFSQLGYEWEQATEYLSQASLILSNVGDINPSDAASSLVSILKGFRLEAEDTYQILDILNESGNRFALTTADLTEGLRIGGASLALANNDLKQASSLIITGTEILRDSNLVANGLKTISMRIKGLADENGELALGLENTVKILTGVDLKDPNNEFRSTYDILKDIGEVWDDLSDLDKATLAEDIAGKNRVTLAPYVQKCA